MCFWSPWDRKKSKVWQAALNHYLGPPLLQHIAREGLWDGWNISKGELWPVMMSEATGKVEYKNIGILSSGILASCQPVSTPVFAVAHADSGQGGGRVFLFT